MSIIRESIITLHATILFTSCLVSNVIVLNKFVVLAICDYHDMHYGKTVNWITSVN